MKLMHSEIILELNNMAWGFARLGHRTERTYQLLEGVAEELVRRTWHFKPQDVGATLWSFATIEHFHRGAFEAGAARLNFRHIRSFKVRRRFRVGARREIRTPRTF